MANVTKTANGLYSQNQVSPYGSLSSLFTSNPRTEEWAVNKGILQPLQMNGANGKNGQNGQLSFRLPQVNYTPNQNTVNQLGSFGSGRTVPQWMMDSYANKIGSMGGNADAPIPFGVNQGGFPGATPQAPMPQSAQRQMPSAGVSGKTGPYLQTLQGLQGAVGGAFNASSDLMGGKQNGTSTYTSSMGQK